MSDVQEVRDRIIQLAREIEDYSKANVPPRTFFHEFLRRVVGAVGARAGVVWLRNGSNRLELFCDHNLSRTSFGENPNAQMVNHKLLAEVISNGQACTYHPGETNVELPTEDMVVLAALQQNKEVVGVVQVFQRNDTPPAARPGFLQFVEQMTGYACRYLDNQSEQDKPEAATAAVSKVAEDFEQFVLQLHNTLDFKEVAFTAANDGRLLVGCDRMSIAVLDGRKTVIRAISGQERVNHRANLVRRMTKLASRVIATKETTEYTGKVDHLAPKVEKALADFIQESGSRMVTVIPIFRPDALVEKEEESNRPKEKIRKPVGGLIIEQVAESQPKPGVLEKANLIGDHVGSAIFNAKTHHRLFLMPLWKLLGKCFAFLEGRNGVKAALIVTLIGVLIASMVLIPWEYRVEGEGRMMPVVQKDVFAPWDGEVVAILVKSGMKVEAGQTLVQIENPDLAQQYRASYGEWETKLVLFETLARELSRPAGREESRNKEDVEGQLEQTRTEIESLVEQLKILDTRIASLDVKAPISGTVATFQIEQLLQNRPVRRGEVLLEIKNDGGIWQLELEVEEKRMGHLFDAQQEALGELVTELEKAMKQGTLQGAPESLTSELTRLTVEKKLVLPEELGERQALLDNVSEFLDQEAGPEGRSEALDALRSKRDALDLPVEFVLATDAESTFDGKLSLVDTRVNSSEEAGSVVMVFASFDKSQLPRDPRIGADVRAKVSCTEMSLGYVLFGDVVEFVQKYFWL
jgi:multidrug efflux pump subunit AcrA (membrane-fusion protein)